MIAEHQLIAEHQPLLATVSRRDDHGRVLHRADVVELKYPCPPVPRRPQGRQPGRAASLPRSGSLQLAAIEPVLGGNDALLLAPTAGGRTAGNVKFTAVVADTPRAADRVSGCRGVLSAGVGPVPLENSTEALTWKFACRRSL